MTPEEIVLRFERLSSSRTNVQEIWEEITDYVVPYRGRFFDDNKLEESIQWQRGKKNYDSTASHAHSTLSSNIHGALTSPNIRWFNIRFRSDKLNDNNEAQRWIEECSNLIHYELVDSNFGLNVNEVYQDITSYATGVMTLEDMPGPGWNGLNFTAIPLKEAYFEEDYNGRVKRFYRDVQFTPVEILSKFKDVPQIVTDRERAGNTDKMAVLFCIYPRHNRIIPMAQTVATGRRPWEYSYILKESKDLLGKGAYYEQPAFVARWLKTSESMWGYGPAHLALGDIRSLNSARELQLTMAEKLIDPAVFIEERALINDLSLTRASLNVVRNIDGIKVFESKGSIPVSDHMIDQLQQAIKDYFFVDQMIFPRPQGTPMSATEVMVRQDNMAKFMAPTMARLQNDLLDPIISRSFRMMARAGILPEAPAIVMEEGADFDIMYMGSLSRAQSSDKAASVERLVGNVANLAPVFPEALDVIDSDEMVRGMAADLNVPAKMLRSKEDVEAIRGDREAKQKAMEEAMIQEQQATAQQAANEAQA